MKNIFKSKSRRAKKEKAAQNQQKESNQQPESSPVAAEDTPVSISVPLPASAAPSSPPEIQFEPPKQNKTKTPKPSRQYQINKEPEDILPAGSYGFDNSPIKNSPEKELPFKLPSKGEEKQEEQRLTYQEQPPIVSQNSSGSMSTPLPIVCDYPNYQPTIDNAQGPVEGNISQTLNSTTDLEMQAERNAVTRELVKKFVADIWNRGDLEFIPRVCHPGLRFNGSVGMDRVGHAGFARMVTTIRDALNDYHCEIHSMVVEGNKAFCRMRFTGRHTGPLLGFAPTGKQVAWMGAAEFTCKNGQIIKVWELGDVKSLEEQLGE